MATVKLILTQREVPCTRRGRPSYRWATGYYVVNPATDQREYPPVSRGEAYDRARALGGARCRVEIRNDAADGAA